MFVTMPMTTSFKDTDVANAAKETFDSFIHRLSQPKDKHILALGITSHT